MNKEKINVTQPFLPDLDEFIPYLEKIWDNKWLTNSGPMHRDLEKCLAEFLGVKYVTLFANGTLALMHAIQVLEIKGEVITTPFSFVATSHALFWNKVKPVFVDIESEYLNLDPSKIEKAITESTSAILPVHVYGNPCNVHRIQEIANKHNLKVIYDAAHTFNVRLNNESILNFGDMSVLSFHATKIFNTFEGGAIICQDEGLKNELDRLKNFGFENEINVTSFGINSKMSEIHAAFGLLQLKYVDQNQEKRCELFRLYRELLGDINGLRYLNDMKSVSHNYSYFPIMIDKNDAVGSRDELFESLKEHNIFCRRYFYPLISNYDCYKGLPSAKKDNLPVANRVADEVICLPIYSDLEPDAVRAICSRIKSILK